MQSPPSPIVFDIGVFSLHYYGVIMFVAIIFALFVIRFVAHRYYKDVDTEILLDVLPFVILSSILGARLYYVVMDFSYYSKHLPEIFAIWNGGMSIHGGILGGVLSGFIISKFKKISFFKYADVVSYGLILGQAIGRFGNYFNCEAFGKPCSIPFLKLFIPLIHRPMGYENFEYFHPTFLYESIWDLLVFIVLFFIVRRIVFVRNLSNGTVFCSYLILYSIGRFFIEWCRLDSVKDLFGLPIAQVVSVFVIVFSALLLIFLNKKENKS